MGRHGGHVAGTCCSDKTLVYCTLRRHVAGTKSQDVHTRENVAGTCFKDMLQRHVPSCELILL